MTRAAGGTRLPERRVTLAVSGYATSLVLIALGLALTVAHPHLPREASPWGFRGFSGLVAFAVSSTGVLLRLKRPESVIGRLLEASGLLTAVQYVSGEYAAAGLAHGHPWPGTTVTLWMQTWEWIPAMTLGTSFLFLRFPDGRLPTPRWRGAERATIVATVAAAAAQAVKPGTVENLPIAGNPWAVRAPWATTAAGIGMMLFAATLVVAAASLFARRSRASATVRIQLRWLGYAAALVAVLLVPSAAFTPAVGSDDPVSKALQVALIVAILGLPVSICVAVTRYRLYEIDRLISRTLSYALLTSSLVGVYVGVIAVSTRVLPFSSSFGVAASTLAAAALFNPMRRRVQEVVDRRFNRARYDADRLVESFTGRVRDAVTVDALVHELGRAAQQAVEPTHVSIWTPTEQRH